MAYDFNKIEEKWQKRWTDSGVFEGKRKEVPSFFVTFPYPYLNGPLHLGHAFTATRADVFSRYKRMCGLNVLFPFAFHATGEPVVGMAKRVKAGDKNQIQVLKDSGVAESEIKKFEDPQHIIAYYRKLTEDSARRLGFGVDWKRSFVTTDPEYAKFIQWQYLRLKDKGHVGIGTHPVIWCPKCRSPTGDHDRLEGEGVSPAEFVILKFRFGDSYLTPATLRPETIYGVTNMWVNPETNYVKADVGGEKWIISRQAAEKLKEQLKKVKILEEIAGKDMVGKECTNPVNDAKVLILPAGFVDPDNATGIVMSVPAHAPYDYLALEDLKKNDAEIKKYGLAAERLKAITPISMIKAEGFGEFGAVEVAKSMKIKDQNDPRAEDATKEVYRKEFHTGVLKDICGEYAGVRVRECKEKLAQAFKKKGFADSIYETERPVVCRSGDKCIVKILENQWFLKYSDKKWKSLAKKCFAEMRLYPEDSRAAFENTIEWLQNKACARRSGLGTKLPWDEEWIVETLSDSTIYMAFYTIAHKIYGKIPPEKLIPEVFDYVFRGENKDAALKSIDDKTLDEMRKEFDYWYPVDFRNSADELIYNHLTFFVFHHTALFPETKWPRSIGVNGMMMIEGEKMSKSKGNFITVLQALKEFSADTIRLNLMYSAEGMSSPDWRHENAVSLKGWFERLLEYCGEKCSTEEKWIDRWLISRMQQHIRAAKEHYDETRFRSALQAGFFDSINDIKWYLKRGNAGPGLAKAREAIVRMVAPVAPHVAEEAWEKLGNKGSIINEKFAEYDEALVDAPIELGETCLQNMIGDTEKVIKLSKIKPKKISIFIAPGWKRAIYEKAKEIKNPNQLIKEVMADPEVKKRGKEAVAYVQYLSKHSTGLLSWIPSAEDETKSIVEGGAFLKKLFNAEILVKDASESDNPKARNAVPMKPAIFVE